MEEIFDVVGVGIGPYNLGLAAMIAESTDINAAFFDENDVFLWHPGMLIDGTDLQVPFLADLITLANPQSRYTFLNYAHAEKRLMSFYFFNRFDIPRMEYNAYCQWVAGQLSNCHFGTKVLDVQYEAEKAAYRVVLSAAGKEKTVYATHIVVGTGSVPLLPGSLEKACNEDIIHSSDYRFYEKDIKEARSVTVIGSGQSAAEIFYSLLQDQPNHHYTLNWFTRSPGFFQLEESKIGQELFSPDFVSYFHELPYETRKDTLSLLGHLRNGVQAKTLHNIYDLLYHRSIAKKASPALIRANMEVTTIEKKRPRSYQVIGEQTQQREAFAYQTEKVILATGYKPNVPRWLEAMQTELEMEGESEFKLTRNAELLFKDERKNRMFSLTNLEHALGTSATNLALSVERNARIVNELCSNEVFQVSPGSVFQQFGNEEDGS
ncbi:SidA/IucD/PvdA family monooxygenase [Shouchella clausii]|uniref:lysine N(6)-hydroxylase/L-ornithine N(5)-oxygenase family protein n=1 Tax=Shouchella clausii TaxID=79880 RepID=UPI0039835659